jgi:hypothetical protein
METHQPPPPPVSLLYTVAKGGGAAVLQEGGVTLQFSGTGGTCDCFSLNIHILGRTAVLHLAHFCGWGCAKLKPAVYLIQLCLCTLLFTENLHVFLSFVQAKKVLFVGVVVVFVWFLWY